MTKFIWVRDRDKNEHYINVDHIIRATKRPAHGSFSAAAYLILRDKKEINLSQDMYDTVDDVILKIQDAMT